MRRRRVPPADLAPRPRSTRRSARPSAWDAAGDAATSRRAGPSRDRGAPPGRRRRRASGRWSPAASNVRPARSGRRGGRGDPTARAEGTAVPLGSVAPATSRLLPYTGSTPALHRFRRYPFAAEPPLQRGLSRRGRQGRPFRAGVPARQPGYPPSANDGRSGVVQMQAAEKLLRRVDEQHQQRAWIAFPYAVMKKFGDDQAGNLAALIAYYGFLSLFPLLLVLVTLLGMFLRNNPGLQGTIRTSALANFPVIGDEISKNVHSLRGSGLAL